MKVTTHAAVERIDRIMYIAQKIGWGNGIVLEVRKEERGTRECLTDSGVLIVKGLEDDIFVTAFVPSVDKVYSLYHSLGKRIPSYLLFKIKKNQKYSKDFY